MWTFEEAMEAVQALQPEIREFGFHLTLGGGVLNNGSSNKDLDLYFIPLNDVDEPNDVDALVYRLEDYFGDAEPIGDPKYADNVCIYRRKLKFEFDDRRIDAFII